MNRRERNLLRIVDEMVEQKYPVDLELVAVVMLAGTSATSARSHIGVEYSSWQDIFTPDEMKLILEGIQRLNAAFAEELANAQSDIH
jgi:hypothetical protein